MAFRFERLTLKSQEAVQQAQTLAQERGHPRLEAMHLLVALLHADQQVVRREDLHRGDAECGVHRMGLLPFEVDDQLQRGIVKALDLSKSPAPVDHVCARFHGLKFGLGGLEGGIFC